MVGGLDQCRSVSEVQNAGGGHWGTEAECGTKRASSSRPILRFRHRHEGRIPAEVFGQVVIEHVGTDLELAIGDAQRRYDQVIGKFPI